VCIAPALLARVMGQEHVAAQLTIGKDPDTAGQITAMGAVHVACPVTEFVVDRENRLVSSPAYMLAQNISEVAEGIDKAVRALLDLVG
jgi:enhancing lycopene biosynthesis protein 2